MLRCVSLIIGVMVASPLPSIGQATTDRQIVDRHDVRAVQRMWLGAYVRGDSVIVRLLSSPTIRVFHSSGNVLDHGGMLKAISAHAADSFFIADQQIVTHGDVSVASARITEYEDGAGTSFRAVDTFMKMRGQWTLITSHWTRLPKIRQVASIKGDELESYVGTYLPAPGVRFSVVREGSQLRILPPHVTDGWGPFVAVSESTFYWRASFGDVAAHFVRDQTGRVVGLDVLIDGEDIIMTREGTTRAF